MYSIHSSSLPTIRKNKLNYFCSKYTEAPIVMSISLACNRITLPEPTRLTLPNTIHSWNEILGQLVYCDSNSDYVTDFKAFYKSLPYHWQLLLYTIATKKIVKTLGESVIYTALPTAYTKAQLVGMLTMPMLLDGDFTVQNIAKGYVATTTYPITIYRTPKVFNHKTTKYFLNYGNRVVSNIHSTVVKRDIKKSVGAGRYGVLCTDHKVHGFKYKRTATIIATGTVEDIIALYRGKPFNQNNITFTKNVKAICKVHCDSELVDFLL